MKNFTFVAGLCLFLLLSIAAATPAVNVVVTTPLYANAFSTLTCRYITNDSAATVQYRWYKDGIWYSTNTATYSSLSTGSIYKCAVNLTHGSSTGWQNSSNNITVASSCLNQYPFVYKNIKGNLNITSFFSSYPVNIKVLGGDYKLFTNHNRVIENKTFIFIGGDYGENGVVARDNWLTNNIFSGNNFVGNINTAGQFTDENYATYFQYITAGTNYGYLTKSTSIGTVLHIRISCASGFAPGACALYVQANNSAGWDTLASKAVGSSSAEAFTDVYVTTTEAYQNYRIYTVITSSGTAKFYELEMVNFSSGTIAGTYTTPTYFSIDNFTQTEGAVYSWNYLDEGTRNPANLSTGSILNSSKLNVYCSSTVTDINTTEDIFNKTYYIGIKEIPRKIETLLTYDDTSSYYRRLTFCDRYDSFNYYLVDAAVNTPRLYTFSILDESGEYSAGSIELKRYVDTVLEEVTSDEWDASFNSVFYLLDNREYSINLISDGCGSSRNIGWVTTNPASTSLTLTVSGGSYNTSIKGQVYHDMYYYVQWDNRTGRINCTFFDAENLTNWFWWGIYDSSNDSIAYSDNTTSWDYLGSYLANRSRTYYVKFSYSHPRGSVHDTWEGTVKWYSDYLSHFRYSGEILGLSAKTAYLFISVAVICLTALVAGSASVGLASVIIFFEVVFFSVIQWLPFFSVDVILGQNYTASGLVVFFIGFIALLIYFLNGRGKQ